MKKENHEDTQGDGTIVWVPGGTPQLAAMAGESLVALD